MHVRHLLFSIALALTPVAAASAHGPAAGPAASTAPEPIVTPVMTKALKEYPGKEVLILNVEYPPGGADPVHRHDAHGFVYVLEGTIVMGVKGGKEVTLKPGEAFHEGPEEIHTVGRNARTRRPPGSRSRASRA